MHQVAGHDQVGHRGLGEKLGPNEELGLSESPGERLGPSESPSERSGVQSLSRCG